MFSNDCRHTLQRKDVEKQVTVALQFNSHKLVQKLFHNLHIIFSNSLMGCEVIFRIVKQVTGLLLSKHCKNMHVVKQLIWKFIDIFPKQALNFLNIFIEHGKIIANHTKSINRISQLLCRNVIVEQL